MGFNKSNTYKKLLLVAFITIAVYAAGIIYLLRVEGGEAHYIIFPILLIQAPLTISLLFKQKWAAVSLVVYFCIFTTLFAIGLLNSLVYGYSLNGVLMDIGITMIPLVPAVLLIRVLRNDKVTNKKDR